jgi:hypothetical protein
MIFGTADFSGDFVPTGDPTADEGLTSGTYMRQQWAGVRRVAAVLAGR